jgi:hydroxypyruvate isomerase
VIDFSVCIELAFTEGGRALPDRVRAASDAGFPAVEIWAWQDKSLRELQQALSDTGTSLHTLCVEDWRDKCQLGDPQSHPLFIERVTQTARVAADLGAKRLVVLAGDLVPDRTLVAQREAAAEALLRASDAIAGTGLELLLEVVNRAFEGPNALIADTANAVALLRAVNRPNVRLVYDRYHAILNGEPLGWAVGGNMDLVSHVQVADIPGRHEFGTGTHDWVAELAWLTEAGYDGLIGIEASPLGASAAMHKSALAQLAAAAGRPR